MKEIGIDNTCQSIPFGWGYTWITASRITAVLTQNIYYIRSNVTIYSTIIQKCKIENIPNFWQIDCTTGPVITVTLMVCHQLTSLVKPTGTVQPNYQLPHKIWFVFKIQSYRVSQIKGDPHICVIRHFYAPIYGK